MAAALLANLALPLDDADRALIAGASADLKFLLDEMDVEQKAQAAVMRLGYKTIALFGTLADDRAGVRAALAADLGLDPNAAGLTPQESGRLRLLQTRLLASWLTSSTRSVEEAKSIAETRALRLPLVLPKTSLLALRRSYETEFGRQSDTIYPCAAVIERLLDELDEGTFSATPLTELISVEAADDDLTLIDTTAAKIKVRKAPRAIPMPSNSEEYRRRMRTLAIVYELARFRHRRGFLAFEGTAKAVIEKFVDYVLGEEVAGFEADGLTTQASWATVLGYEFQMRRFAAKGVLYDNHTLDVALLAAQKDLSVKERHFITPTAMMAATQRSRTQLPVLTPRASLAHNAAGAAAAAQPSASTSTNSGAGNAGLSKRKVKKLMKIQKLAASASSTAAPAPATKPATPPCKTPDGRLICRYHNERGGCKKAGCTWAHVCSKCFDVNHTLADKKC